MNYSLTGRFVGVQFPYKTLSHSYMAKNKQIGDKMKFEEKLNLRGKFLTGMDLINSPHHDNIIMVRTIEANKDSIVKDPVVLFPVIDKKTVEHIYREYCATALHNGVENLHMGLMREAINLCFL